MDVTAGDLLAEVRVGLRIEDERVPAYVHQRGRAEDHTPRLTAGGQEAEGLVHDALGPLALFLFVIVTEDARELGIFEDAVHKAIPQLVADEMLVNQVRPGAGYVEQSCGQATPPRSTLPELSGYLYYIIFFVKSGGDERT